MVQKISKPRFHQWRHGTENFWLKVFTAILFLSVSCTTLCHSAGRCHLRNKPSTSVISLAYGNIPEWANHGGTIWKLSGLTSKLTNRRTQLLQYINHKLVNCLTIFRIMHTEVWRTRNVGRTFSISIRAQFFSLATNLILSTAPSLFQQNLRQTDWECFSRVFAKNLPDKLFLSHAYDPIQFTRKFQGFKNLLVRHK